MNKITIFTQVAAAVAAAAAAAFDSIDGLLFLRILSLF